MNKTKLPKKWTDVYPHGTKAGDEEQAFFISLARNPKWTFRGIGAIAQETGLSKERVEELIEKYFAKGMIVQNPNNEDMWGYWERNLDLLPKEENSLTSTDHDDRIRKISFTEWNNVFKDFLNNK